MAQPSWIGKQIGDRYHIESLLGQGGMSSVYKGTDPNLRRSVALKMIHPHLSQDSQFVSRFEEEAAAVARLKHPNIIQVFDFDHDDDTYYMVLEYVPGETLQSRLQRLSESGQRMPLEEAVEIAASVCDALDYAHNRDMIHRDIKPANIMINEQGQAVLMDFGVAKIIGGKQHTATGVVVGTPTYISPEQIRRLELDRRVDIYALGVTLFEMLSGQPPFDGDSALSTMMMHINEPVPDLRKLNPSVPPALVGIAEKALAKDREQRYSTAQAMARDLRQANVMTFEPADQPGEGSSEAPATVPPGSRSGQVPPYGGFDAGSGEPVQASPAQAPPVGPPAPPPRADSEEKAGSRRGLLAGGALVIAIIACLGLAIGGYLLFNQFGGGASTLAEPSPTPTETSAQAQAPTATPTEPLPTDTPEPTVMPTATEPRGPYVRINGISLQAGRYIVDYETFGYIENLPGQHVHFFFDTVAPEQAGVPGSGPWYVWGGPRPFNGYSLTDRPAEAAQMCSLSANPDHSIVLGSGNCVDLPEG